ncbi:Splicing factor, partial [Globisporangium splendens]
MARSDGENAQWADAVGANDGDTDPPPSGLQLGIRGYACQVFDDARVAWSLHREQHLIPWRMASDLRVDRFDARNLLDDKALFRKLKKQPERDEHSDAAGDGAQAKADTERLLHELRYGDYAVEFPKPVVVDEDEEATAENKFPYAYPEDHDDDGDESAYSPPWLMPEDMVQPRSKKLHEIISATAKKAREHPQLEVLLRVKLRSNIKFGFLDPTHAFNAYYVYLRDTNPPSRDPVAQAALNGRSLLGEEYDEDSDKEDDAVGAVAPPTEMQQAQEGDAQVTLEETSALTTDEEKRAMRLKRAKLLAVHFQHAAVEKKAQEPSAENESESEQESQQPAEKMETKKQKFK